MKNNKGFTLVEVIVVIALLASMVGLFSINMTSELNESKNTKKESEATQLKMAADAYVYLYLSRDEIVNIKNGGSREITYSALKSRGLVTSAVDSNYSVIVSSDSMGALVYEVKKN